LVKRIIFADANVLFEIACLVNMRDHVGLPK